MRAESKEPHDNDNWDEQFEQLYENLNKLLESYGRANYQLEQPYADYTVYGEYDGYPQLVVFATSLKMLRPEVIKALQKYITAYPDWEIVVTVAVREHLGTWPEMGLYVRAHEIIDGLQREYFPKGLQDIDYSELEGVRPGRADD